MRHAIQNKTNPKLFWTDEDLETGKAGWVEYGFDIYDSPVNPKRLPENGVNVTAQDLPIPDRILSRGSANGAAEYIRLFTDLRFTDEEIQMIARQADITLDIISGGEFATIERELFQDALAKLFVPFADHWPTNNDDWCQGFPTKLMRGIDAWRDAGHKFRETKPADELAADIVAHNPAMLADALRNTEALNADLTPLGAAKKLIGEVLAELAEQKGQRFRVEKLRQALALLDTYKAVR